MQLLLGDSYITLKTLPDESVQTCITSPPYYGLRDFGVDGQLGLENTPEEHIARMVEVFREVRRVLKNDGTLWLNLGDTYAGGGRGGDPKHSKGDNSAQATAPSYKGIPAKNLLGMPWRVALALQADGWYLRQDIIWHKPNVMPENVRDRCTKAHEYIFLLSKSAHYYFNADAIREPHEDKRGLPRRSSGNTGDSTGNRGMRKWSRGIDPLVRPHMIKKNGIHYNPRGRGKRSVWTVAYSSLHPCRRTNPTHGTRPVHGKRYDRIRGALTPTELHRD